VGEHFLQLVFITKFALIKITQHTLLDALLSVCDLWLILLVRRNLCAARVGAVDDVGDALLVKAFKALFTLQVFQVAA
jgi:hypothetical protein